MFDSRTYGLDHETHRLAGNIDETLEPQHIMICNHALELLDEGFRLGHRAKPDDEALELIVVVLLAGFMLHLMMRFAVGDIFLGADAEAEQQLIAELAEARRNHVERA